MVTERKIALLVDIDNVSMDEILLAKIINQAELAGEIVYGKFYGFSDRKHKDLQEIINSKAYDVAQRMRLKRKNKSGQDSRILIDAIKIACTNPVITGFCLVGGEGDYVPLVTMLKSMGKYVLGGFIGDEENLKICNDVLDLEQELVTIRKPEKLLQPPQQKFERKTAQKSAPIYIENIQPPAPIPQKSNSIADSFVLDSMDDSNAELKEIFDQIKHVVEDFGEINRD